MTPVFTSLNASSGVPTELFNDMKKLQDSVKNLERKNRELNRQLTLTEVSNVVDLEKKYRLSVQRCTQRCANTRRTSCLSLSALRCCCFAMLAQSDPRRR